MPNHPAQMVTFAEVLAYIGFSDDEIDSHQDKYDSLLSAYRNSEFRSLCLKNHYYLTLDNDTISTVVDDGYIDIKEAGDGLFTIEYVPKSELTF